MKTVLVILACCLWLTTGFAQVSTTRSLPPTPLEAYAARPRAKIKWSKIVGVESAGWTATGLIICGYQFSNLRSEDLAELLTRSITELKAAGWDRERPARKDGA